MAGYAVRTVDELPRIDDEGVDWRPVQHFFGLTAFGMNVYRAAAAGDELAEEHDETAGGHEEVYVVLEGSVRFEVDGRPFTCARGALVAVRDPALRRRAEALEPGATILAVGGRPDPAFASTWEPDHFRGVPTIDDAEQA